MSSDYRFAPQFAARLLGLALLCLGGLVFLTTAVVVLFAAPVALLGAAAVLCVVGVFALGWFVRNADVVRLTEDGYQVRFVRGAGAKQARWSDVESAGTDEVAGTPCLLLRLRNGQVTTIPVEVLAVDREDFARQVHEHLKQHDRNGRKRR